MESERSYSAVSYSARSLKMNKLEGAGSGDGMFRGGGLNRGKDFRDDLFEKRALTGTKEKISGSVEEAGNRSEFPGDVMMKMMFGNRYDLTGISSVNDPDTPVSVDGWDVRTDIYAGKMSVLYIFSILFEDFRSRIDEMMAGLRSEYEGTSGMAHTADRVPYGDTVFRAELTQETYYREEESTSFKARGKARCSDGREIDFDINVGMSRSFEKISKKMLNLGLSNCIDPLVINLKDGVTSVSDRYIYFDLDGDGEEERIKSLSESSGYLALDKNGDGIINDGTELFGTASGDGFTELAAYDSDGDGWIDEDDEIFDKLKVWIRNEDGTDTLLSFKDAGVGAINLANSRTEYSIKDKNNRSDAIIRSTGMFLYEDGRTGTVQQVDMVS